MAGKHITEAVWHNAQKELPNSSRSVLIHFVHYEKGGKLINKVAEARLLLSSSTCLWDVDSKVFNQSIDKVVQWAEIDPKLNGCLPDPFPNSGLIYEFV